MIPKVLKLTCRKLWCLSACKKSTSSLTSFMRYYKGIANFLFWEFWESLSIPIKNHCINFKENFMLICMQKINFISNVFLEIFQRNSKLVILGHLGMLGHTHIKWKYQFLKISDVYLQAKNQLHPWQYCKDIANLLIWVLWKWQAPHTQSDTINF